MMETANHRLWFFNVLASCHKLLCIDTNRFDWPLASTIQLKIVESRLNAGHSIKMRTAKVIQIESEANCQTFPFMGKMSLFMSNVAQQLRLMISIKARSTSLAFGNNRSIFTCEPNTPAAQQNYQVSIKIVSSWQITRVKLKRAQSWESSIHTTI